MSDSRIRELERKAEDGDAEALQLLRHERHRLGINVGGIPPELAGGDWDIVFGVEDAHQSEGVNGKCTKVPELVPPGSKVDGSAFTREDVVEVLHVWEVSGREWADWTGVCVVRLFDGRFASASGWSDSSGWG